MNGVHIFGEQGQLGVVATNGHALAEMRAPAEIVASFCGTIPTAMVTEVTRAFADESGPVHVTISQAKIQFTTATAQITSKLIDGQFPPYERVIPSDPRNVATVDMDILAAALRRVTSINSEKTRGSKLTFGEAVLGIAARGDDADGADEVEYDYAGETMTVGFNSNYLIAGLSSCASDVVRIRFDDGMSPMLIEPVTDERLRIVVMPLRV
jgi:DNA polymerase-3 subunit beta